MRIENNEVFADEGFVLFNGEIYSEHIILGIYDTPSNWQEIPIEEVPNDE